jgi:signal recognition particle subunit SRP72
LPTLEEISASSTIPIDLDLLENQFSLLSSKYSKLKTGQIKSPDLTKDKGVQSEKAKLKKKKKVKLPKNLDPNAPLDLERWLPLRERSYYRGKRNKKKNQGIGKGTQGAVSTK